MRSVRFIAAALATTALVPTLVVAEASTGAGASSTPLTIAYVSSITGLAGSQYTGAAAVFQAALDAQNAAGGIDGHKLQSLIIDDQTNPSLTITGVEDAASKGAIGIVANDPLWAEGGDKASNEAGLPVTGTYDDGPEWGEQPYTNLFAADNGSVNPKYPASTLYGKLVKLVGGTKAALYALSISPGAINATSSETQSIQHVDPSAQVVIDDRSVAFGASTNFEPLALAAKQAGVDVVFSNLDSTSAVALATAYKQAGVKTKGFFFPSGYDPSLIHSPEWSNLQGDIFEVPFHPFYEPNAGTEAMQSALEKYAHWSKSQFPNYSQYTAWISAELMLKGIERAGANPTPARVIKSLRSITNWTADGLLQWTDNYTNDFGHDAPATCVWLTKAEQNGFVPMGKNAVCGTDIPGTTSVVSSS